jgi:hypothetical protein
LFCTSTRLIRRKRTVTYQGQYFTINSHISECDHRCETRNAELEIRTDGSCQTRQNPRVDRYGSGFGPPRVYGSGVWMVLKPNRPVFAVQTRTAGGLPGPVANTIKNECNTMIITPRRHKHPSSGANRPSDVAITVNINAEINLSSI